MEPQDELVPGVLLQGNTEDLELRLLEKELRTQAVQAEEIRSNRIQSILIRAGRDLQRGIPVEITDEMVELGIDKKIKGMRLQADYYHRLNRFLLDDDDDEVDDIDSFY